MTALAETTTPRLSTRNKLGFVLALILGVADTPNAFTGINTGKHAGPPFGILVIDSICGLVTIAAVVWAWRKRNRTATRIAAAARIVSVLTALPAFFVDVPPWVKVLVAGFVVITVVTLTLMLTPPRERPVVTD